MEKIIGIDLGTSYSVVSVIEGGDPVVIASREGSRLMPSVVAFTQDGKRLVGEVAKRQAVTNPENTIFSIKRFMGRRYDEVSEEMKIVPYQVIKAPNSDARIEAKGKHYSPPEISAMILQKIRDVAEQYLGQKVTKAVITVPSYWNDSQRQATKEAGTIAGLDVLRIIHEPTAAALAYGLDKKRDETIAVYDFGGGTFNISILEVGEGVVEVKSTNGDSRLGGDNLDQRILDWMVAKFKKDVGIDLSNDSQALQRLREAAENAKKDLSLLKETDIRLPFVTADQRGPKHLNMRLTRAKFEQLIDDLLERTLDPCRKALKDAGLQPSDIDKVLLVGGSTRIPKVQELVKNLFRKELHKGVNPNEVVAIGAAIEAGIRGGEIKDLLLLDIISLSLGIETIGGVCTKLVERNTTIPTRKSEVFSTMADNQTSIEIHVLQGEREMARDNRTLGKFHLVGIPPAPRGIPQIEVTFDIDANGIVNVSAKDLGTGKEQQMTLTASSGLSEDELDRMIKDAEFHAQEDRKKRETVDVRNQADSLVYQTEKLLNEHQENISASDLHAIEVAIKQTKEAIISNDVTQMRTAIDHLTNASYKIVENPDQHPTQQPTETQLTSKKKNEHRIDPVCKDDALADLNDGDDQAKEMEHPATLAHADVNTPLQNGIADTPKAIQKPVASDGDTVVKQAFSSVGEPECEETSSLSSSTQTDEVTIIRVLRKVTGKQLIIDLPDGFDAKEVEILIVPYQTFPSGTYNAS